MIGCEYLENLNPLFTGRLKARTMTLSHTTHLRWYHGVCRYSRRRVCNHLTPSSRAKMSAPFHLQTYFRKETNFPASSQTLKTEQEIPAPKEPKPQQANLMEAFTQVIPITESWKRRRCHGEFSARRPRHTGASVLKEGTLLVPLVRHRFGSRIACSTASPGMGQSQDDKQKHIRKGEDSKNSFDRRNLEMGWKFQTRASNKPVACESCHGTGRVECSWCHATGVLMLGDRLMCSLEGHSQCLACDNGELKCKVCKGTGMIASWMVLKDL